MKIIESKIKQIPSMIFERNGEKIVFDDFVDETKENKGYWVDLCSKCQNKYKDILGERISKSGAKDNMCSVRGCFEETEYYVDFKKDEVRFE